jgi:hypothetical protein
MSALRFLVLLVLGGCGGDAFSGREPPAGSGGADAGEGGTSGASPGGEAGAAGSSAQGGGPGGGSDAGSGGDGARGGSEAASGGDGAAGEGQAGQIGRGGAAGDGAGGQTSRDCNVTCCDGEEATHTTFDAPLCVSSRAQAFCDEHGGPRRVEFDGVVVWEENECVLGDHNCVATCCDGSRSYITQEAENECAFYGLYACEHDGGPVDVAFEGQSVFTADVECPTARTCVLECCDGFKYDRSPGFGTNNCVFFHANSSVCADEGHLANKQLVFGGEVVWDGTCP